MAIWSWNDDALSVISLKWAREIFHCEGSDMDEEWLDVRVILRKWSIRWSMVDGERKL